MSHKQDREEQQRLRLIEEDNNKLPQAFLDKKAQWEKDEEEQRLQSEDIRNHCKLLQDGKTLQALIPFIKEQIEHFESLLPTNTLYTVKGMLLAYQELEEFINNYSATEETEGGEK